MKKDSDTYPIRTGHPLPKLQDPDHPGIFLISNIVLISSALFLVLIIIAIYTMTNVSLNFELSLNGIVQSDQIVLYAEESQASMIVPGDSAHVFMNHGKVIEAEVINIRPDTDERSNRYIVMLMPKAEWKSILPQYTGQPLSATVFTTSRSLWSFVEEKIDY